MKTLTTLAALAALALHASADVTVVDFSFDNTANDTGPAFQHFDNATGSPVATLTNGVVSSSGTAAAGFNTVSSVNLSSYSGFTVKIVVESSNFDTTVAGYNGSFLGIATGANANNTDGTALWNNVGTSADPAIGVQFGDAGRGTAGDIELAVDAGAASYTTLAAYTTNSANDGFTLFLSFSDNGENDAGVSVATTGLETELAYTGTVGYSYDTLADAVSANVSAQGGGAFDLASYSITAIPEPATLGLVAAFGGAVLFIRRRFMM